MSFKVGDRIKFGKDMGGFSDLIGIVEKIVVDYKQELFYSIKVSAPNVSRDYFIFHEFFLNAKVIKPISFHYSI